MRRRSTIVRRMAAAVAAAGIVVSLAACSADDSLASQYRAGDNKGYIAGAFAVKEYSLDQRPEAVTFRGTLEDGSTVTSKDYAGKVLVVNFWYAQCAPCRQEAPRLEQSYQQFQGQPVAFLGVNIYDQAATAIAFDQAHHITYPSVIDVDDKTVTAAFADLVPLQSTPVTVILDKQGRPAARIIGELPAPSILSTLVQDALDGKS